MQEALNRPRSSLPTKVPTRGAACYKISGNFFICLCLNINSRHWRNIVVNAGFLMLTHLHTCLALAGFQGDTSVPE